MSEHQIQEYVLWKTAFSFIWCNILATSIAGCMVSFKYYVLFIRKRLFYFTEVRNVLIVRCSGVRTQQDKHPNKKYCLGSYYSSAHIFPVPNPLWRKKGDCHRLRQQVRKAARYHQMVKWAQRRVLLDVCRFHFQPLCSSLGVCSWQKLYRLMDNRGSVSGFIYCLEQIKKKKF